MSKYSDITEISLTSKPYQALEALVLAFFKDKFCVLTWGELKLHAFKLPVDIFNRAWVSYIQFWTCWYRSGIERELENLSRMVIMFKDKTAVLYEMRPNCSRDIMYTNNDIFNFNHSVIENIFLLSEKFEKLFIIIFVIH